MQTWPLDYEALEVVEHCWSKLSIVPLLFFTHDSSFMNYFFMIDYKIVSFCWIPHCWLQWFFLLMLWSLVSLCRDRCFHHDAIIMFIVHWSSSWWRCAHCNCNNTSHLVVFCFYFCPFEVANFGVLWSDHYYHLGMILMLIAHWSLSRWCCAHQKHNNPSQFCWCIKSYKLTIGTCVLCLVFHAMTEPLPSKWIIITISIFVILIVVLLYITNNKTLWFPFVIFCFIMVHLKFIMMLL
jgi:hypothetical protein